jgi:hypothetical protein
VSDGSVVATGESYTSGDKEKKSSFFARLSE